MLPGNCLAQDVLSPLAFLHCPETGEGEVDALHYAMFFWVPTNAEKPNHLWLGGANAETEAYATLMKTIDAGLEGIDSLAGLHSFNDSLGDAGNAALYLAVAVATQSI